MSRDIKSGFTLIELLVVMAIIVIVLAFAVPAVTSMSGGNRLTQGSQQVIDTLALARQTAISKNRSVEVRFLKYTTPNQVGAVDGYHGVVVVEIISADKSVPIDRMASLPQGVVIDSSAELSSIIGNQTEHAGSEPLGALGTNYNYVSVRFKPNGSADLAALEGPWFLTVHEEKDGKVSMTTPPPNFVTIEVDPVTGTLKFYRPGV